MPKVLIFGDSIAWGAFDVKKAGWVERLKANYLATFKTDEVSIYNLAISGNDTRGVLFSLEKQVDIFNAIEPEDYILLFSIGSNDAGYTATRDNPWVPFDEFRANVQKIIALAKKRSSRIAFTGLMVVNQKLTMPWKDNMYWVNEDIERYNNAIEDICKKENVDFISLWNLLSEDNVPDGLHPDEVGHKRIYSQVKEYLDNSFKR